MNNSNKLFAGLVSIKKCTRPPMALNLDVAYTDARDGSPDETKWNPGVSFNNRALNENKSTATKTYHACFDRLDELEQDLCSCFNHIADWPYVEKFFALISRLGNGVFWYVLMTILPFADSVNGLVASLHMSSVALVCLALYKLLKNNLVRQRPYLKWNNIQNGTAPLDLYSFPSGHTLHAVAFTIVALSYYPILSPFLVSVTLLIAFSRVILGLHYPSDVLAGALIGAAVALLSFSL
ncbi:MAG: phosphatase PAP2 family protein [Gammaproteobacteria bacterium]|nr:phosphatase PAP2 family protein [Gammaproteobacteria bacterium]